MLEVPGDFSMSFLDHVDDDGRIKLIGACNELNGSYAADGWARVLQSDISAHGHEGARLSCLSTTFGVGELSAINGLGESERVSRGRLLRLTADGAAQLARSLNACRCCTSLVSLVRHRSRESLSCITRECTSAAPQTPC